MGLIAQCDGGCGATTDDVSQFKEFGIVKKVWYCEKCAESLDELYEERDELHTKHARALEDDLLFEIGTFQLLHTKARLPDAPE